MSDFDVKEKRFEQDIEEYLITKGGYTKGDGVYHPFHIYSMRQAIEEGFILDVLRNYMTYKMYYKIVKNIPDDPELDSVQGAKAC